MTAWKAQRNWPCWTPFTLFIAQGYAALRLYINFFQPVLKLVAKERVDGKTIRTYDQAKTPFRRVLALVSLPVAIKVRLTAQYVQLNPVTLRASIDAKVAQLWKIVQ